MCQGRSNRSFGAWSFYGLSPIKTIDANTRQDLIIHMDSSQNAGLTMHRLFITIILCLGIASVAYGTTAEIPVTPASLDTYFYVFSVSTNVAQSGIIFHVTMTAKTSDIDTNDSSAGLTIVTHTKTDDGGLLVSRQSLEPAIPVTLKKEKHIWTADFIVSHELLTNPDLYFDISFLAHRIINGKSFPMPSVTCYEIRLEDFTGQISHALGGRWQTASGDTYEFTDDGTYEHWLQKPPISKLAQADASEPSNRTGISGGKFSVNGNFLILTQNNGTSLTNEFYITKGEVNDVTGKFFGSGYSFIIISYRSISKLESSWSVSKYELMYL
jgi:hypothetical protein